MSHTYNLPFTRYGLRGVSDLLSCTAMSAMTTLAYQRMISAGWIKLDGSTSDMPTHQFRQTGFFDGCDAAKYCGDYDAGEQKAYAAAVCYTIKIPADAMSGTVAKVESISATLKGDRWTACGAVLAVIPSTSPNPPSWADVLSATYSSPDPVTAIDDEDPTWQAPLRKLVRSNDGDDTSCDATIPLSSGVDATAYLHVVLRLGDYISAHGAWIEGSAMVVGATLAVTFDRSVTADAQETIELRNEYSLEDIYTNRHGFCSSIDNETAFALTYFQDTAIKPTSEPGDAVMMRRVLESREHQHIAQQRSFGGTYSAGHGIVVELATWGGYIGCRYQNLTDAPKWHRYELRGLFFVRSAFTSMETVAGLSFDSALPAIPAGETVRIAMYAHDGPLPPSSMLDGDRIGLNMISMHSASDYDVVSGVATTIKLAVGSHVSVNSDDSLISNPMYDAPVVPLGHYDIVGGTGLAANTMIPFAAPYTLPRYVAIFVAINVIKYDDNWVAAPDQHTSVRFNPSDFFLHVV